MSINFAPFLVDSRFGMNLQLVNKLRFPVVPVLTIVQSFVPLMLILCLSHMSSVIQEHKVTYAWSLCPHPKIFLYNPELSSIYSRNLLLLRCMRSPSSVSLFKSSCIVATCTFQFLIHTFSSQYIRITSAKVPSPQPCPPPYAMHTHTIHLSTSRAHLNQTSNRVHLSPQCLASIPFYKQLSESRLR